MVVFCWRFLKSRNFSWLKIEGFVVVTSIHAMQIKRLNVNYVFAVRRSFSKRNFLWRLNCVNNYRKYDWNRRLQNPKMSLWCWYCPVCCWTFPFVVFDVSLMVNFGAKICNFEEKTDWIQTIWLRHGYLKNVQGTILLLAVKDTFFRLVQKRLEIWIFTIILFFLFVMNQKYIYCQLRLIASKPGCFLI